MGRLVPRRKTLLRCFWCPIPALLLSLTLFGLPAATAGAQGTPAVVATAQGITVALANLTPYVLNRVGLTENAANAGPGYPVVILPYQHTGTSVTMRGGVASGGESAVAYAIGDFADNTTISFQLFFKADTIWDFDAAASLMLHAAKSKATSSAKSKLKDSAKDGAEAAGAADGMTEVIEVYKLVKLFAKLFGALDPTFVMDISIEPFYEFTVKTDDACISKNQNSPGPAVVEILGPSTDIGSANVGAFYVAAAGSSNKYEPGFVDLSVHSLCDYVCAVWNSTLDELNETSQSDCADAQSSGSTQQANYNEIAAQNSCLTQASASNGIPWVTIESDGPTYKRYDPSVSCSTTTLAAYEAQVGICGGCAPLEASEPLGSWSESCDEVSYSGGVLTANCATNTDPNYTSESSLGCSTGHWNNDDGELACAEPPGSWSTSCDFVSFSGTTLCASCATDTDSNRISESCQPCTSDVWSNVDGFLSCAPPPATQTASRSAPPPAASKVLSPPPHGTPPDPPGVAPNVSLASNPNFETLILGADR